MTATKSRARAALGANSVANALPAATLRTSLAVTGEREAHAVAIAWAALADVPDPEIPVVSIVELGIVRSITCVGKHLRIHLTPTYSGCPATEQIETLARERLAAEGLTEVELIRQLAPAWTTDWIAPEARAKLAAFGIAPPHAGAATRIDVSGISPLRRSEAAVACPRCGSAQTRLLAQFGSTACKALYRCEACREPFDYFKPH